MDQRPDRRDPREPSAFPQAGTQGEVDPLDAESACTLTIGVQSAKSWEERRSAVQLPSLWCITITAPQQ